MTGYFIIAFMAFLKACLDAWENENYFESIFKHWNQKFWYKRESWKYAKKLWGYKFDAWHIGWTIMVFCIAALTFCEFPGSWWVKILNVGLIWNAVFNIFYHGIFKIK